MRGHRFVKDEDANVDLFAGVSSGNHNGPLCVECGWARCMHCAHDFDDIPQCEESAERIAKAVAELDEEEAVLFRRPMRDYPDDLIKRLTRKGLLITPNRSPMAVFTKFGKAVFRGLEKQDGA